MQVDIIHNIDCLTGLKELPDESIDICVTSPPYNLDINYGSYQDNKPFDEYLLWLDETFIEIHRVLKDAGSFWLNVGYSNINPWIGIDVANVARKQFVLQNNIVWVKSITIENITKGHFKPINSNRFANPTWEHLFHFTKTGKVAVDRLSIGVPYMWDSNLDNTGRIRGKLAKKFGFKNIRDLEKNCTEEVKKQFEKELNDKIKNRKHKPNKRCRGNTWYIPYETISNRTQSRGKHPATFPEELVENCIKFSGIHEGVLLDPFMGTGSSAVAAIKQGINYIGYDIDKDYIEFSENRILSQNKDNDDLSPDLFDPSN